MLEILLIIAPVFILLAFGYVARFTSFVRPEVPDIINEVSLKFSIPVLLFRGMYSLDFSQAFHGPLLISFFSGALSSFVVGLLAARFLWKRPPGESVAVGFAGFFSTALVIGLPITQQAFGSQAADLAYGIIALHAPIILSIGIVVMELSRRDGLSLFETLKVTLETIFHNTIMIGILFGLLFNLLSIPLPTPLVVSIDMVADAAIPIALFGMGAALTHYTIKSDLWESSFISFLTLIFYPFVVFCLSVFVFNLPKLYVQTAVIMASVPAGLFVYIFASLYNRAVSTAASVVLISTVLSVFTLTGWLHFLRAF